MSVWELWLLLVVLPGLDYVATPIAVVATIVTAITVAAGLIVCGVGASEKDEEVRKVGAKILNLWKVTLSVMVLFTATAVAVPDREQIMYIVGGSVVTNAEGIQELPDNLVQYANRFLEQTDQDQETSGGGE